MAQASLSSRELQHSSSLPSSQSISNPSVQGKADTAPGVSNIAAGLPTTRVPMNQELATNSVSSRQPADGKAGDGQQQSTGDDDDDDDDDDDHVHHVKSVAKTVTHAHAASNSSHTAIKHAMNKSHSSNSSHAHRAESSSRAHAYAWSSASANSSATARRNGSKLPDDKAGSDKWSAAQAQSQAHGEAYASSSSSNDRRHGNGDADSDQGDFGRTTTAWTSNTAIAPGALGAPCSSSDSSRVTEMPWWQSLLPWVGVWTGHGSGGCGCSACGGSAWGGGAGVGPFGVWLLIVLAFVLAVMFCMVWCFGCFGCFWMCRVWRRQDKLDKYVDDITTVPMASQVDEKPQAKQDGAKSDSARKGGTSSGAQSASGGKGAGAADGNAAAK